MIDSVHQTWDVFSKIQDDSHKLWVDKLWIRLFGDGVNPDHAIRFLKDTHLGQNLAQIMAFWTAANPDAVWDDFQAALGFAAIQTAMVWARFLSRCDSLRNLIA